MPPRRVEIAADQWPARVRSPASAHDCSVAAYRTNDGSFAAVALNGPLSDVRAWRIGSDTFSQWRELRS
jgi:hypothetical protein